MSTKPPLRLPAPPTVEPEITIIPPDAGPVEPLNSGEPGAASTALTELRKYADTRLWKAEARRQTAIADTVEAKREVADAMLSWRIAEERLQTENLERMQATVRDETRAIEVETELRFRGATHELQRAELEHQAQEAELRERIAKATVSQKKWEKKLTSDNDDNLDSKIKAAEAKKQDIMDAYAEAAKRDGGTIHDYNEERDFERKLQRINEELDELYEQQRQQQADEAQ